MNHQEKSSKHSRLNYNHWIGLREILQILPRHLMVKTMASYRFSIDTTKLRPSRRHCTEGFEGVTLRYGACCKPKHWMDRSCAAKDTEKNRWLEKEHRSFGCLAAWLQSFTKLRQNQLLSNMKASENMSKTYGFTNSPAVHLWMDEPWQQLLQRQWCADRALWDQMDIWVNGPRLVAGDFQS